MPTNLTPWLTLHGLVTVTAVLVYVVSAHVTRNRRNPAAAIAWIFFILLLPYVALPAFLTFGSRKLARPHAASLPDLSKLRGLDAWAVETIMALGQPAPAAYHGLNVHSDGHAAQAALMEILDAAQSSLDICTFILGRDHLGEAVLDKLCAKAQAGVRVRLMLDGMGSMMARPPDLKRLVQAGGQVVVFVPPLRSPLKGRSNLRDHRKLTIADAGQATARLWCGGRNLAAEYFGGQSGEAPWHDLTVDLQGPLVAQASALFEHDWAFASGQPVTMRLAQSAAASFEETCPQPWLRQAPCGDARKLGSGPAFSHDGAQLVASGPDQEEDTVYSLLVTAAYRAQHRIALATPYFVPDAALLMALCLAARRGVVVDLLMPAKSNHRMSDFARSRALRTLARAGARIWLVPGMLHAKLAVVDELLALNGSANFDSRSLFLNYELMLAFHKADDVRRFADWFENERQAARPYVAVQPGLLRDVGEGMLLWLGFQL